MMIKKLGICVMVLGLAACAPQEKGELPQSNEVVAVQTGNQTQEGQRIVEVELSDSPEVAATYTAKMQPMDPAKVYPFFNSPALVDEEPNDEVGIRQIFSDGSDLSYTDGYLTLYLPRVKYANSFTGLLQDDGGNDTEIEGFSREEAEQIGEDLFRELGIQGMNPKAIHGMKADEIIAQIADEDTAIIEKDGTKTELTGQVADSYYLQYTQSLDGIKLSEANIYNENPNTLAPGANALLIIDREGLAFANLNGIAGEWKKESEKDLIDQQKAVDVVLEQLQQDEFKREGELVESNLNLQGKKTLISELFQGSTMKYSPVWEVKIKITNQKGDMVTEDVINYYVDAVTGELL